MNTRRIVINVTAALAILSVPAVASAQAATPAPAGAQDTAPTGAPTKAKTKTKTKTKADADADTAARKAKAKADEAPAIVEGTSAQAAERADATAPHKAPAVPEVPPNTPAARFGAQYQISISSDIGLSIEHTSLSGVDGSTTTLQLHPAFDYFVIDNLSVGGFVGLDYLSTQGGHTTKFSIGPRIGYNIAFADRFSIWPKVGLSFSSTSQTINTVGTNGTTSNVGVDNTALALNIFVPVMFHPVEHFYLGFGPALDLDLSGDNKATTVAGRLTIGGWL